MAKRVIEYRLTLDMNNSSGEIECRTEGSRPFKKLPINNLEHWIATVTLLREGPVFLDVRGRNIIIRTGPEPVIDND